MNNAQHEINDNLYSFYDQIAQCEDIYSEKQEHWAIIKNHPGTWPRLIYRLSTDLPEIASFAEIPGKVKSGVYPEILIVPGENIRQTDPFLRANGFYPYTGWKGMARENTAELITPHLPDNIEIVTPHLLQDKKQWSDIVSTELIAPTLFDVAMIEKMMSQPSVKLYLLKKDGVGITTLLTYESSNSVGLYLLATLKSSRRKGFGFMLLEQTVGLITRESKKPIILHATQIGENLHVRLGFQPYNQFFLYRYLNPKP